MQRSHVSIAVVLAIGALSGCASSAAPPPQLAWSALEGRVADSVAVAQAAVGARWQRSALDGVPRGCDAVDADYDDQQLIPLSSGTALVWSGSVPAAEGTGEGRRILRDRLSRSWRELGLVTRYEPPGPASDGGRVVAILEDSQQFVVTAALHAGVWSIEARVACATPGLPSPVPDAQ